jgi:hypothetical protein
LEPRTSLFSVGSPLIRKRAPRGLTAATFAPALLRSSPTTNSSPRFVTPESSSLSAAAIIAAIMPFASHEPRPQINSASSSEGKKGGTVSMCVESVTMGSPHDANILSRFGSTAMRSSRPEVRAASMESCANKKSATFCSRLVVDSMSTSARVSSKRFIRTNYFWRERNEREEPRRTARGCCLSIALHPALALAAMQPSKRMTVDRP